MPIVDSGTDARLGIRAVLSFLRSQRAEIQTRENGYREARRFAIAQYGEGSDRVDILDRQLDVVRGQDNTLGHIITQVEGWLR